MAGAVKKTFGQKVRYELSHHGGLYVLAMVPFVYLIIFRYIPMYGLQIAFKNYKVGVGIAGSEWVGLKHFTRFISSPKFSTIITNTIIISLYGILTFPLPILLALMLTYLPFPRYRKAIQMVSYAPHFISTVVMVGIILQFLDKNYGLLNLIISTLGGQRVNFMAKREYFYHIYQWSGVWQGIGYSSIIYFSALSAVPAELHEAAIIDGASLRQRMVHIDIPCILPTICILLIMQCGHILDVGYEKVYLMQNNLNLNNSEIISTYVYKQGLTLSVPEYSYSTAISLFTSIINVFMLIFVNTVSKKLSGNGLW